VVLFTSEVDAQVTSAVTMIGDECVPEGRLAVPHPAARVRARRARVQGRRNYWHLVEAELRAHGHGVVAPDVPADDEAADLNEYADTVVEAVGGRKGPIVVGQSFGAFTAPLVAARLPVDVLVLVAGMISSPGEAPKAWWENTGYRAAVREQAARDGGQTGNDDPLVSFYHDVPRGLAEAAMSRERAHPSEAAMESPRPLAT
jgi:pimeloyl-ACP methyl ester carboxylesterase